MLGVPQSFVAKVELGERRIDVVEFLALVAVINASWKEILKKVDAEIASKTNTASGTRAR